MLKVNLPSRLRRKSVGAKDPLTAAVRAATSDMDSEDLPDDSIVKVKRSDPKIAAVASNSSNETPVPSIAISSESSSSGAVQADTDSSRTEVTPEEPAPSGSDGYGYTQTVFGSFHENFQQRAQKLLRERRQAVATSRAPPLKRTDSGVIARPKTAAPEPTGHLSTSESQVLSEEEDDEADDDEAEELTAKYGTVAAALYWAVEKATNVNTVLVYLFLVGIITGILCVVVDICVYFLTTGRMYFFTLRFFDDRPWLSFPLWIAYTCGFVGLSLYFTHSISPTAAGSGIPEMKSILSGVTLNKYLSPQTFVAKFLGLITCMSSGMIVGRAGPFVHIASIVANQVAKMRMFTRIEKNASLKNHMLAAACGIGMSGSHGAAFGGVLFSIEVTSTYYPIRNYWYSFIGAFVAAITFRIGWNSFVGRSIFKPFLPTKFHAEADPSAFDWLTFILLGVLCGCLSLLYVNVNEAIVKFRRTYASKYKILGPFPYAVLVGFCSALLTFPGFFGTFVSNGNVATIMDLIQDRPLNGYGFLNADWAVYSKYYSLTVIVLVRFILQTIVVSVPAPIGVFSPLMALGACFGRLTGEVLRDLFPMGTIPPAAYAIAGAASTVGGVTHTLSAAMFMFEATGDLNHSLGVLLSVIISVGISKRWGLSIFDSIQKIRGLPFMPDLQEQFYELKARDVMERDVPCLNLKASIEDINQLLEKYISNSKYGTQDYSIPIIETPENKIVVGATNVNALIELVEVLEYEIVRQKQVHDLTMSGIINVAQRKKEQQKYLQKLRSRKYDLRNRLGAILLKAPIVFDPDTPVEQLHVLFLTLRLKNAFVVKKGKLKGNVTQKNLSKALKIHPCILGLFLGKEKKYLQGFNTMDESVRVEFRRINDKRVRIEIWFRKDAQQKFENVQERLSKVESAVRLHIRDSYDSHCWLESRRSNICY